VEGNPTQEQIRRNGALLPLHFCINVTLNNKRQITGYYVGDALEAHRRGCAFAKETAMVACDKAFPVVVTTNGGYPLDQNLYQTVKGMSAAAQIIAEDGYILTAARCNDGFPSHGNFKKLLFEHGTPKAILDTVLAPGFSMFDQWEAQMLAMILVRARAGLYSEIPDEDLRRAHEPEHPRLQTPPDHDYFSFAVNFPARNEWAASGVHRKMVPGTVPSLFLAPSVSFIE